jgi:hypothetical protein
MWVLKGQGKVKEWAMVLDSMVKGTGEMVVRVGMIERDSKI